jgi:hypothetical protein
MAKAAISKPAVTKPKPAAPPVEELPPEEIPADDEHGQDDAIAAALEGLDDDAWENSDAKEGFGDVDPGKYQVVITDATLGKSKTSQRLQVTFALTILSNGLMKGRKLWKRDGLDNEDSIGWFKGGLARLGLEPPKKKSELPDFLAGMVDTYAQVTVKHKKDPDSESGVRVNTYFDKALDEDELDNKPDDLDGGSNEAPAPEPTPAPTKPKPVAAKPAPAKPAATPPGKVTPKKPVAPAPEPEPEADEDQAVEDPGDEIEGEGTGEEAGEVDDEAPPEEELATETGVTVEFDEKSTGPVKRRIEAVCKVSDYDPKDYKNLVDVLADVAEYVGVTGTFKDAKTLVAAVEAAQKAAA